MELLKNRITVNVSIDKELLNQKLNKISELKEELSKELNSISDLVKIID